ncbi:MAG: AcrR family transcriptional regulator [Gammaproteobacteria bacterium]|jgi:AcrR family transcriptional regulator
MQKAGTTKNSVRGSADIWLDAAYQILVESGVESVKIMTLANQLKVSRTSFYWHFSDRDALLDALVLRWQTHNTGNLIARTELYADTITEAVLNLCDCWVDPQIFDSRLDFAIRNWAHHSAKLKAIFEETDKARISAIHRMFLRFGFSQAQADIRAHTVYFTQVGYISMMIEETLLTRIERVPAYVERFSGQPPTEAELARFSSRHLAAVRA